MPKGIIPFKPNFRSPSPLDRLNMIIFGTPGSGKEKICKKLVQDYQFYHINSGDQIRKSIEDNTFVGNAIRPIVAAKKTIDSEILMELVENAIDQSIIKGDIRKRDEEPEIWFPRFLIDGMPLDLEQAKVMSKHGSLKYPLPMRLIHKANRLLVVSLEVRESIEESKEENLEESQEESKKESKEEGKEEVSVAAPDNLEEIVKKRLKKYDSLVDPMLGWYRTELDDHTKVLVIQGKNHEEMYVKLQAFIERHLEYIDNKEYLPTRKRHLIKRRKEANEKKKGLQKEKAERKKRFY